MIVITTALRPGQWRKYFLNPLIANKVNNKARTKYKRDDTPVQSRNINDGRIRHLIRNFCSTVNSRHLISPNGTNSQAAR